ALTDFDERTDIAAILHEELDRMPEKFRAPIVLCYLESLSHEQAARQLCWPVGTVRSRLARGREQLRSRLARRGLAPSLVGLKQALAGEAARSSISPALASAVSRAALHCISSKTLAAGATSRSVALLVEGALKMMVVSKIKFALITCGLITTGAI